MSTWFASWMNWVALLASCAEEDSPMVGEYPDRIAVDRRPAGHETLPVERLELVESGSVCDPGDHLTWVEGVPQVRRGDAEQVVRIEDRFVGGHRRARAVLSPVEPPDDLATRAVSRRSRRSP